MNPPVLADLRALTHLAETLSARQHAGLPITPAMWSELYDVTNRAKATIQAAETTPVRITTLQIEHKHGINIYLFTDQRKAVDKLTEWAIEDRDFDGPDEPKPDNHNDLRDAYWEEQSHHGEESYIIDECVLNAPE